MIPKNLPTSLVASKTACRDNSGSKLSFTLACASLTLNLFRPRIAVKIFASRKMCSIKSSI